MNRLCSLILVLALAAACEQKAPPTNQTTPAETDAAATGVDAAAPPVEVRAIEYDDKLFPAELPAGEALGGFAFEDSAGSNFVAFSREETTSKAGELAAILHIKHVAQKGEAVAEIGSYREVIESCEFDTILAPKFGDWSVSDLDSDGIGEASFAYTADCTSDVSPNKHKVLITEAGEKFGLRGVTSEEIAPGEIVGGEFDADDMPDEFRDHADMVWQETSVGLRMK